MSHKKCQECGASSNDVPLKTPSIDHLIDGVHTLQGTLFCPDCASGPDGTRYYCYECEDFYVASEKWSDLADGLPPLRTVPCKKHSAKKSSPCMKCDLCGQVDVLYNMTVNKRGQVFCGDHPEITRCKAKFCRAWIHPNMPGVVKVSLGICCEDCAPVRQSFEMAPAGYHPFSWDYKEDCVCFICKYLRGKGDKWPKPKKALNGDGHCTSCPGTILKAEAYEIDEHLLCHVCQIIHLKECAKCNEMVFKDSIHPATPPVSPDGRYCDDCMEDLPYWFCDVTCNSWWDDESECVCGGVHPYNYKPELIFMTTEREADRNDLPFIGVELEVEAQKGDSSRAKGAKLVRRYASDFTYVVHDATLAGTGHQKWGKEAGGHHGFEVVTHPFTYEWFQRNWNRFEELMTLLSAEGYRSWEGGRCGIHIHISREPMTHGHQMKFIKFIYGSTNLALAVGQRGYNDKNLNQFAPFHGEDRSQLIKKVKGSTNPGVYGHYTAISTNTNATIEGRWFRGTLNPMSFRKNVEFMHSVWHFTKRFGFASANEANYIDWLRTPPESRFYATLLDYLEREYITRR